MVEPREIVSLLKEFGRKLGLPETAFGPSGECLVGFDGIDLDVAYRPDTRQVTVEAEVGELAPAETSERFARLLELNLLAARLAGGFLGIDRSSNRIVLVQQRAAEGLSQQGLNAFVGDALAHVETWRSWLANPAFAQGSQMSTDGNAAALLFRP